MWNTEVGDIQAQCVTVKKYTDSILHRLLLRFLQSCFPASSNKARSVPTNVSDGVSENS